MRTVRTIIKTIVVVVIVVIAAGLLYIYSGAYNVGQDVPHNALTHWLLKVARQRSIANHDSNVTVPPLDKAGMATAGARLYASHCSGCHLAPGKDDSPIHASLYPQPPTLAHQHHFDPATTFWIVKHGIKFTAMPAWGKRLDDTQIWQLVAFLKQQPTLSAAAYAAESAPVNTGTTPPATAKPPAPATPTTTARPPAAVPTAPASTNAP